MLCFQYCSNSKFKIQIEIFYSVYNLYTCKHLNYKYDKKSSLTTIITMCIIIHEIVLRLFSIIQVWGKDISDYYNTNLHLISFSVFYISMFYTELCLYRKYKYIIIHCIFKWPMGTPIVITCFVFRWKSRQTRRYQSADRHWPQKQTRIQMPQQKVFIILWN